MSKDILILGIHDGHNCGAALTVNGRVAAAICEERLTRRKNDVGFPERSIREVLRLAGADPRDLAEVAYASEFMHQTSYLTDLGPWYRVGLADQRKDAERSQDYQKLVFDQRRRERIEQAVALLGGPAERVGFVEHHLAHAAGAYYTYPHYRPGEPVLCVTCDGSGDGVAATVNVCRGNAIERIATTGRHASLGKIYSRTTMLMGMTPWEHEYKLMGLAPYADPERCHRAAEPLRQLLRLRPDGLGFEQVGELSINYCYEYLREAFERVRFDVVAGAAQLFTEEMLLGLVRGAVAHTGIGRVCLAGGVFMNVKANMLLAALPEVERLHVMPSCADESLAIGACLHRYYQLSAEPEHASSVLENLYLGGDFGLAEEEAAVSRMLSGTGVAVSRPADVDLAAADMLARGQVVARSRGRMEWGARALGNRSILARADDYRVVAKINDKIKMRDFWMPFAPSIRAESAGRYFDDPKDQRPHFMIYAYPSKPATYPQLDRKSVV